MRTGQRHAGRERGALLLEVVLALAIFVSAGIAILSLMGGALDSLGALRERVRAADLARSAMARIEAGIADPIALNGPVRAWEDEEGGPGVDMSPRGSGWELAIETEPSEFAGLTRVSVTARRTAERSLPTGAASYTLHQLVRLSGKGEDTAGGKR